MNNKSKAHLRHAEVLSHLAGSEHPFVAAVSETLEGWPSLSPGDCDECLDCQQGATSSDGFSWQKCECCGTWQGGQRYNAHALDANYDLIHFDICEDCVAFLANGTIPDEWDADCLPF